MAHHAVRDNLEYLKLVDFSDEENLPIPSLMEPILDEDDGNII